MAFVATAQHRSLRDWLMARHASGQRLFGLCGSQGSGKSTLAHWLVDALAAHNLRAWVLSLDDLYLGRAARAALAERVHPLLATRGVPGTHDVALGAELFAKALELPPGAQLAAPVFEKARDDRAAEPQLVEGPVDLVLFEGWCVGVPPQADAALQTPINAFEEQHDPDGVWRHWANAQLAGPYAAFFSQLDATIFLQTPSFETVYNWRWQQEQETIAKHGGATPQTFTPETLREFLSHYERLTRHALATMPTRADACLTLGDDHEVLQLTYR